MRNSFNIQHRWTLRQLQHVTREGALAQMSTETLGAVDDLLPRRVTRCCRECAQLVRIAGLFYNTETRDVMDTGETR